MDDTLFGALAEEVTKTSRGRDTFNEFVGHALRHLYATLVLDPICESASNFDPRFSAKRLEQQQDWIIRRI
jgi:hypothetical protein